MESSEIEERPLVLPPDQLQVNPLGGISSGRNSGAHPESFQLETTGSNIYVNLPDLNEIAASHLRTGRWPLKLEHNFPMALDEADHRLFVASHDALSGVRHKQRSRRRGITVRAGCR
jgi:hypothetical protein